MTTKPLVAEQDLNALNEQIGKLHGAAGIVECIGAAGGVHASIDGASLNGAMAAASTIIRDVAEALGDIAGRVMVAGR
jgi:hypothetical protein